MRILSLIGSSLAMLVFCFLTSTLMPAEVKANDRAVTSVAVVGGFTAGLLLPLLLLGWLVSDDADDKKKSFQFKELEGEGYMPARSFQFKELGAEGYLPARSWFGLKQNLTESVQVSLGGFWLKDNSIATLIPSQDNLGTDFSMAYATPRFGSLTLTSAVYYRGDQNPSFGARHSVEKRKSEWDMVAGLRWRKRW